VLPLVCTVQSLLEFGTNVQSFAKDRLVAMVVVLFAFLITRVVFVIQTTEGDTNSGESGE